jgi:hypothetical protein
MYSILRASPPGTSGNAPLYLVYILCRSYEKKSDFAGPPGGAINIVSPKTISEMASVGPESSDLPPKRSQIWGPGLSFRACPDEFSDIEVSKGSK